MYRSLPTLLLLLGLCFRNTIAYHTSLQLQDSHAPSSQTLSAYVQKYLRPSLSPRASLSLPNSATFQNLTTRWSTFTDSKIGMVVEVAEAQDVAVAVKFANQFQLPFLAVGGGHGTTSTLKNLQHGVSINLRRLNNVQVAADGIAARVGGGVNTHQVIQELAKHGKVTATTNGGCTGHVGPGLGGGFGRYMGYFGLVLDNIIDMTVVLANGSTILVSQTSYPDLFWGMLGAGQNFGIVTEANIKIYDSPSAWFYAEMQFTQEKLEAFFNRLSMVTKNGTQPKELGSIYSYFALNPKISVSDPVILMQFAYAGTEVQAWPYLRPFLSLNPTTFKKNTTISPSNIQRAASQDSDSTLCADGLSNFLLFPLGLQVYNTTANRAVYNLLKNLIIEYPAFNQTIVQLEDYALEGMKKVDPASTAYPHRDDNILVSFAPVYKFAPELDSLAFKTANQARDIWHAGDAPWRKRTAYLNYAAGDETTEQLYGYESWRLERLRALKKKYDPNSKFIFFNPLH